MEAQMSDEGARVQELERRLSGLGGHLAYPRGEQIDREVLRHIETSRLTRRVWWRYRPQSGVVSVAVASLVIATAIAGLLLLFPGARDAVADFLRLRGVRIRYEASPPPEGTGAKLLLGEKLTLAEASQRVSFEIVRPTLETLGDPDELYVLVDPDFVDQVSLVWLPRSDLPATGDSGVGILLTQFQAQIYEEAFGKFIGPGVRLESLTVNGARGFWIEGSHVFSVIDPDGDVRFESLRIASNTLLWERGGLTLRLESSLSKDDSLRIARSVR